INGNLAAGTSATFNIQGTITESGVIIAGALSGSAFGSAGFTGNNTIAALNGFNVSGDAASRFTLNDRANLQLPGTLSANRIAVTNQNFALSWADGATIVTGGTTRPSTGAAPALLLPQNGAPGAFFRALSFSQTGRAVVLGAAFEGATRGPATLQIS